jgi:hypothetical protein
MKKYLKIGLYGFLIWLIPFFISFIIFPLRDLNRPLFESIMPVILTLIVFIFSILYFKNVDKTSLREGLIIGLIWFFISIIIDLILFMPSSPMQMTFMDYMMDIGFTYLIIFILPIGVSFLKQHK